MSTPQIPEEFSPLSVYVESFDHFAFAVSDLRPTATFFQTLGGDFLNGGSNRRMGFRWMQFMLPGGVKVEAIAPVEHDCFLHDFLRTRGEGIHHITFRCTDVAAAAASAEAAGLNVVGLFTERPTWKECFIHPRSAHGTVVQLAEWTDEDITTPTLEAVLATGASPAGCV